MQMYHWKFTELDKEFNLLVTAEDISQARSAIEKEVQLWPDPVISQVMIRQTSQDPTSVKEVGDVVAIVNKVDLS